MSDDQVLYISQALLASAFYYGIGGGFVGALLVKVSSWALCKARLAFSRK